MRTITIQKADDGRWGAFFEGKRIAGSGCKSCVINVVLSVTKNSSKYGYITILNEDGTPERTILTGVYKDGREAGSALQGS